MISNRDEAKWIYGKVQTHKLRSYASTETLKECIIRELNKRKTVRSALRKRENGYEIENEGGIRQGCAPYRLENGENKG